MSGQPAKIPHISNAIENTTSARKSGHEICRSCGKIVIFGENQWRQRCPSCGIVITVPQNRVIWVTKTETEKPPECFLCHDTGLIHYQAQEMNNLYRYVAKCFCRAGEERKEAFPSAAEVADQMPDLRWLAQRNRKNWEKKYGKVSLSLFDKAEQVDATNVPFGAN